MPTQADYDKAATIFIETCIAAAEAEEQGHPLIENALPSVQSGLLAKLSICEATFATAFAQWKAQLGWNITDAHGAPVVFPSTPASKP